VVRQVIFKPVVLGAPNGHYGEQYLVINSIKDLVEVAKNSQGVMFIIKVCSDFCLCNGSTGKELNERFLSTNFVLSIKN
jgi:hypothetical protein